MDDEEDVKKMTELINRYKSTSSLEFEEFINLDLSDEDEVDDEEESDIFEEIENIDISKLNTYIPTTSLKPEENIVINACKDADLKKLLLLNRSKGMQLILLYKKIKDLLIECQRNLVARSEIIKKTMTAKQQRQRSVWKLGAPYFKDKNLFSCPPNSDILRKKRNNELSIYELTTSCKWTTSACEKLLGAVKINYNINKQKAITKEINTLKCKLSTGSEEFKVLDNPIKKLQEELEYFQSNDSIAPPLNSDEFIDWHRISEVFLNDKHTELECRTFWHMLHPNINKSKWTVEENEKLRKIADENNFQNWQKIAAELKTNRSAFATCLHYYTNLCEKFKKGEFTEEEDELLLELVDYYKMGNYIPWSKVVHHFKDRSRPQLFCRYTYYITEKNIRKGKFTVAEDILLMILADKFNKNYKKCSEYFPRRSQVQLKARHNSNLNRILKKGSFTLEEDKRIFDYVEENGPKQWSGLTEELQRCRAQIRQRYHTIKHFLKNNPNKEVKDAPRRHYTESAKDKSSFEFLRFIADQFKNWDEIPSMKQIKKVLLQNGLKEIDSEEEDDPPDKSTPANCEVASIYNVDEVLTEFFFNSIRVNPVQKFVTNQHFTQAVENVQTILSNLNVTLELPHNFDKNPQLDNVDLALLVNLIDKYPKKTSRNTTIILPSPVKTMSLLIPPNLNTIVGLRSLLIKYKLYKVHAKEPQPQIFDNLLKNQSYNQVSWSIERYLLNLGEYNRLKLKNERNVFYKRFYALFKWASLITLEKPSNLLMLSSSESKTNPATKRTYSRANKPDDNSNTVKKHKVNLTGSTSSMPAAKPIKLTPVSKNVVENMLKSSEKLKLFCFDNVTSSTGTSLSVLKELKNIPSTSGSSVIASNCKQEIADFCQESNNLPDLEGTSKYIENQNDDLEDLKKLDLFLKQEKYSQIDSDSEEDML